MQDARRRPGRDLALAYSPSRTFEAVLMGARYTLRRVIRPDAVALCRKACAVPAAIPSLPRPTASLPTSPPANAGAGTTIAAIATANKPNAPRWARAQQYNCNMQPGTTLSRLVPVWTPEPSSASPLSPNPPVARAPVAPPRRHAQRRDLPRARLAHRLLRQRRRARRGILPGVDDGVPGGARPRRFAARRCGWWGGGTAPRWASARPGRPVCGRGGRSGAGLRVRSGRSAPRLVGGTVGCSRTPIE